MRERWLLPGFREYVVGSKKSLPIDIPSSDAKAYQRAYYQLRKATDPTFSENRREYARRHGRRRSKKGTG